MKKLPTTVTCCGKCPYSVLNPSFPMLLFCKLLTGEDLMVDVDDPTTEIPEACPLEDE